MNGKPKDTGVADTMDAFSCFSLILGLGIPRVLTAFRIVLLTGILQNSVTFTP